MGRGWVTKTMLSLMFGCHSLKRTAVDIFKRHSSTIAEILFNKALFHYLTRSTKSSVLNDNH